MLSGYYAYYSFRVILLARSCNVTLVTCVEFTSVSTLRAMQPSSGSWGLLLA